MYITVLYLLFIRHTTHPLQKLLFTFYTNYIQLYIQYYSSFFKLLTTLLVKVCELEKLKIFIEKFHKSVAVIFFLLHH